MELRLVEYFADEFNKQLGDGIDVRKFPKAMAKLKKQIKRMKEILSANTVAPISVELLYGDHDFRSTISCEKFEELCKDLWEKSVSPIKEVLERSGLKKDAVHAVELIGGATRVAKLQAKFQEYLRRKELEKHLDADEALVLGAALYAANLNNGFKLNRRLGVVQFEGSDLAEDDSKRQSLAPRMKKLPSKSIVHNKNFEVSLAYESEDLLPPSVLSPVFARYSVSGLADAAEKYSSRNLSSPLKANLHFSLDQDYADPVTEKKLKKRTFRIPLKITEKPRGPGIPLSKESFLESKLKLEALDEEAERRTAELKNNLEGYIYDTKEKIETSEEFEKISSNEERESFIIKLDEVLHRNGFTLMEKKLATAFEEYLTSLKATGDPLFFRELQDRPEAVAQARKYLGQLREVPNWSESKILRLKRVMLNQPLNTLKRLLRMKVRKIGRKTEDRPRAAMTLNLIG
ncbi:hypothetical protein MLD38_032578 [Melastoma candidum]|uniref:Uncharacterized protein n=1 Tax=Melastoma candidum TaxID=119954 RepID=A0ACB9M487_9MYRT|nr:hypothetical protein MLD38_032578 [Melastoma candidum]